jgi:hypothetical protein
MGLGSRIQGSKRHRIPDPDPQHCKKLHYVKKMQDSDSHSGSVPMTKHTFRRLSCVNHSHVPAGAELPDPVGGAGA